MELVERVGAYVGMAAFLGLAILALLYFSQARDVRRLREWAGRAPERAGDTATQHYLPPTTLEQASQRPRRSLRERIRRIHLPQLRYLALAVGSLVILAGAAYGGVQLLNDDQENGSADASGQRERTERAQRKDDSSGRVNIDPANVTVAVLNGTTVAGLAAQVGEEARADGFTLGTVTNAARTDQKTSQVLYRSGQKNAADAVAQRLGIRSTAPVDPLGAELAGSFDVVVLVGADRAE